MSAPARAGGTLPEPPGAAVTHPEPPAAPVALPEPPAEAFAGANLSLPSLPNLRDVGGHPTGDGGRVRTGLLYRSADLGRVAGADAAVLAGLGLRTVYDLRTAGERAAQPDRVPPVSVYVVADVLRDSTGMTPADFGLLFEDLPAAREALGDGRAAMFFVDAYREFVTLASARAGYGRLFADIATGTALPALFHCTTGKDRTGWAAAALLLFLGVPQDVVLDDYLASGPLLGPLTRPMFDAFAARGGDRGLLEPLLAVRPAYLASALDEVGRRFGTIEGYFSDGLGLDAVARAGLRARLVERP